MGRKNTLRTVALIAAIIGFVPACIPATLTVGWVVSASIVFLTVGDLLFRSVFGGLLNLRP